MSIAISNLSIQSYANQFGRLLDDMGLAVGSVVAALLPNGAEFLYVLRGTTWSSRTFTPINVHLSAEDVRYILEDSAATVVVIHGDLLQYKEIVENTFPEHYRFVVGDSADNWTGFRQFGEIERYADDEFESDVAGNIMMYTSGTTGKPKAVRFADTASAAPPEPPPCFTSRMGSMMLQSCLQEQAAGKHLVVAPLYHAAPSTYAEGAALLGADVLILPRWDAETFLRTVEQEKIVSTFMVPTHIVRIMQLPEAVRAQYDMSSLKLICHGAAPISVEVKRRAIDYFGPVLYEFYGGTEGGGVSIDSSTWLDHPGSVGKPRPGLFVHILDEEGKPCLAKETGEVFFSSPGQATFEYKDAAEKTAAAYVDDKYTLGDIGYIDDEGYLYLCDRKADTIISGGVNIYPAEIEATILQHVSVYDCCVVGILDEEWGEQVLAVVQVLEGCQENESLFKEITELCKNKLSGFQKPRYFTLTESMPRTEAGKLLRRHIRDQYRQSDAELISA